MKTMVLAYVLVPTLVLILTLVLGIALANAWDRNNPQQREDRWLSDLQARRRVETQLNRIETEQREQHDEMIREYRSNRIWDKAMENLRRQNDD